MPDSETEYQTLDVEWAANEIVRLRLELEKMTDRWDFAFKKALDQADEIKLLTVKLAKMGLDNA